MNFPTASCLGDVILYFREALIPSSSHLSNLGRHKYIPLISFVGINLFTWWGKSLHISGQGFDPIHVVAQP